VHHRLIRIGLAALLFVVGVAPAVAKVVECCCGAREEQKAKSCCGGCHCEIQKAPEPAKAPLALRTLTDLGPGLPPVFPRVKLEAPQAVFEPWSVSSEPASNSRPDDHHSRAPPLFCS
jgi:hypothetical protein